MPPTTTKFATRLAYALLASGALACGREARDWREAERKDHVWAYQEFVAAHPNNRHADEARSRIAGFERQFYAAASSSGLLADLDSFLVQFPQSSQADAARGRLDQLLADRPEPFRAVRQVRLRVERSFDSKPDQSGTRTLEPNVDFSRSAREWMAAAGVKVVPPEALRAEAELTISISGAPELQSYHSDSGALFISWEGAQLSGRITVTSGPAAAVERRFAGRIRPPERVSVSVDSRNGLLGAGKFLSDAPFDRAAALPGSFCERLAEVVCEAFGPTVARAHLAKGEPVTGLPDAQAARVLARCEREPDSRGGTA